MYLHPVIRTAFSKGYAPRWSPAAPQKALPPSQLCRVRLARFGREAQPEWAGLESLLRRAATVCVRACGGVRVLVVGEAGAACVR